MAAERVLPAVVRIEAIRLSPSQGRMVKSQVGGSGAIISPEGHVLTNYHVADDAEYFLCHLTDGTTYQARRIGQDALTDLAVLQLDLAERPAEAGPLPVAAFGDSERLQPGDVVLAVGSPASLSQAVTRGIVSNPALVMPDGSGLVLDGENVGMVVRWVLHDASIFPGNSGGPLVDLEGRIVGINEMGVARLGGAIPGNLARDVAARLVADGHVVRGWTGISVQPRLGDDADKPGVLVADVVAGSPADVAGVRAGMTIIACGGEPVATGSDAGIAEFYRREAARMPGDRFDLEVEEASSNNGDSATRVLPLTLVEREPAVRPNVEMRAWGMVVCDITRVMERSYRLPDADGAWVADVRPGGAAGQGEPELKRGDVVIAVAGQAISDVASLHAWTEQEFPEGEASKTVLVTFRRGGELMQSVVELRETSQRRVTPQARKAWVGVEVQPLTAKLAAQLGVDAPSGVRVTRVFEGTRAADVGLNVGDLILAIDGAAVTARRAEDTDTFARQVRQYRVGREVKLSLWRDGSAVEQAIELEPQPVPPGEMASFVDDRLELTVREIAFDDSTRLQLDPGASGLLIEGVERAGWAALAGLRADDRILTADAAPIATVADYTAARDAALAGAGKWWVLKIARGRQTLFIQINLNTIRS